MEVYLEKIQTRYYPSRLSAVPSSYQHWCSAPIPLFPTHCNRGFQANFANTVHQSRDGELRQPGAIPDAFPKRPGPPRSAMSVAAQWCAPSGDFPERRRHDQACRNNTLFGRTPATSIIRILLFILRSALPPDRTQPPSAAAFHRAAAGHAGASTRPADSNVGGFFGSTAGQEKSPSSLR